MFRRLWTKNITLYGDGQQTRSFCFVDDLIEGLIRFMDLNQEPGLDPPLPGPINLGNPVEFTIQELAENVISMTGSKSKLVFAPLPTDDPRQRQPDISLARKHLDWEPKIPLADGLEKTVDYFRKLLQN